MTSYVAAITGVVLTIALFGWLGYRRGVVATLGRCLLAGAIGGLLCLLGLLPVGPPGPHVLFACGVAGTAILAVSLMWAGYRLARSEDRWAAWPRRFDRVAGAGAGVLAAVFLCVVAASAGAVLLPPLDEQNGGTPRATGGTGPAGVRRACEDIAGLVGGRFRSLTGTVGDIPREVRALVLILNASRAEHARLAEKHDLVRLLDVPAVEAALDDAEYLALVDRCRGGDPRAIARVSSSPVTRRLARSPEVRDVLRSIRPSDLAADLEAVAVSESAEPGD